MLIFQALEGFDWDVGNSNKNQKHGVSDVEAEEVFDDENKVVNDDRAHSIKEPRFFIIGKTVQGRLLFVSFTIRGNLIRIISARVINRKERHHYKNNKGA